MFLPRLASTLVLLVLFIGSLSLKGLYGITLFIIIGILLLFAGIKEMSVMLEKMGLTPLLLTTQITAVAILLSMVLHGMRLYDFFNSLFFILLIFGGFSTYSWLLLIFSNNRNKTVMQISGTVFCVLIFVFPLSITALIYTIGFGENNAGLHLILYLVLVTKIGDIAAYVVGTLSSKIPGGNHKIAAKISPKKSWEGAVAGLLMSIMAAIFLWRILKIEFIHREITALFVGIALFFGGFMGDLAESSLKRCAEIKDSGKTIPGIGGVLDLVDSLIINSPLFYLILQLKI